jgi:hypothetical protein
MAHSSVSENFQIAARALLVLWMFLDWIAHWTLSPRKMSHWLGMAAAQNLGEKLNS